MTLAPPAGHRLHPGRTPSDVRRALIVVAPGGGTVTAPLEAASIGAVLLEREADVKLVDLRLPAETVEATDRAEVILLWGTSTPEVLTLARELRTLLSGREFLAAGPGLDPDVLLSSGAVDVVILEGDAQAMEGWLQVRSQGQALAGTRGLAWRTEGGAVVREPALAPPIQPDSLPAPAWGLVELDRYPGAVPVMTGRSCGPRCHRCHHSFGHIYRGRSVGHVLHEVDALMARGINHLRLEDDPINLDPLRAARLLNSLADRGLKVELARPLRADRIPEPLAEALRRSGVKSVDLWLEGVSPRAQRESRLNLALVQAERSIEHLSREGVGSRGRFTLGRPEETNEERRATIEWARRSFLDDARFGSGSGSRRARLRFHLDGARAKRRASRLIQRVRGLFAPR